MNLESVIGLELHLQLKTNSKMFSRTINSSTMNANEAVGPMDIAAPGYMPLVNSKCIEYALMLAFALKCKINPVVTFDRKNYFYYDLAKGYQITQHEFPLATNGELCIDGKVFRIKEMHLEEDTAKQISDEENIYLDYNRSGIPLVEIVFEPDIRNSEDAKKCLKSIINLTKILGISDGKLEDGSLRCDANVSLRPVGNCCLNPYYEIKNVNSVRNLGLALDLAIKEQSEIYLSGNKVDKKTFSYDDSSKSLCLLREKCDEEGYCYVPETNIAPIFLSSEFVFETYNNMPELPEVSHHRYEELGVSHENAEIISNDRNLKQLFDVCLVDCKDPNSLANLIVNNITNISNKYDIPFNNLIDLSNTFTKLINLSYEDKISNQIIKDNLLKIIKGELIDIDILLKDNSLVSEDQIISFINGLLDSNKELIIEYKNGKNHLIKYLMGIIIKEFKGHVDPKNVNALLLKELNKR